jgi:hypothetical protein
VPGNPNPNMSGLKPWKKGHCPNPGGKTREQHRLERKNAETALRIRERLIDSLEHKIEDLEDIDQVIAFLDNTVLKMLKDTEDRGLGAPIQDIRSGDGSMTPPTRIEIVAVDGDDDITD